MKIPPEDIDQTTVLWWTLLAGEEVDRDPSFPLPHTARQDP